MSEKVKVFYFWKRKKEEWLRWVGIWRLRGGFTESLSGRRAGHVGKDGNGREGRGGEGRGREGKGGEGKGKEGKDRVEGEGKHVSVEKGVMNAGQSAGGNGEVEREVGQSGKKGERGVKGRESGAVEGGISKPCQRVAEFGGCICEM